MTCRLTTTTALALCLALPAAAESYDLDALIAAARTEAPITIYDSTSKIIEMADRFTQTYGIAVTGVKVRSPDQAEMVSREARAGNIQGDVVHLSDVPSGLLELIPQGYLESWLPPDLASDIPAGFQDPLVLVTSGKVFVHNTETHDSCPIDTIWDLTRPEWSGRFAMQDPLNTGELTDLFNQMETHADAEVAAAYEAEFGTPLNADGTATRAFVQALAANDPLLTEKRPVGRRRGRGTRPERWISGPREHREIPRQRVQGLHARTLQRRRADDRLHQPEPRSHRHRHGKPEPRPALGSLRHDRRRHCAPGGGRQDLGKQVDLAAR